MLMRWQIILYLTQKKVSKVFVTGFGIISSIGNNVNENIAQLRKGETGIKKSTYFSNSDPRYTQYDRPFF